MLQPEIRDVPGPAWPEAALAFRPGQSCPSRQIRVPGHNEKPAYLRTDVISVQYPRIPSSFVVATNESRLGVKAGIVGVTRHADGEGKGVLKLLAGGDADGLQVA
jgi:hypothetical protein